MTTITKNGAVVTARGLSPDEAEEVAPGWAAAGTDVRLHAVLEVAEVAA